MPGVGSLWDLTASWRCSCVDSDRRLPELRREGASNVSFPISAQPYAGLLGCYLHWVQPDCLLGKWTQDCNRKNVFYGSLSLGGGSPQIRLGAFHAPRIRLAAARPRRRLSPGSRECVKPACASRLCFLLPLPAALPDPRLGQRLAPSRGGRRGGGRGGPHFVV